MNSLEVKAEQKEETGSQRCCGKVYSQKESG